MSERKPMTLDLRADLRERIVEGAECVAVEFHESETSARGVVVAAGSRQECEDALPPRIVVVPNGVSARAEIWDASVLGLGGPSRVAPASAGGGGDETVTDDVGDARGAG